WCVYLSLVFCFFFQAEDGIRDATVTGVQTCALPISAGRRRPELLARRGEHRGAAVQQRRVGLDVVEEKAGELGKLAEPRDLLLRSEERRVGKERRAGCWPRTGQTTEKAANNAGTDE